MNRRSFLAVLSGLGCALVAPAGRAAERDLIVFAAASLKEALDSVAAAWTAQGGAPVRISYAASSLIARQVAAGAPADVVVLANADWMGWLAAQGALDAARPTEIAANSLVLMAPAAQAKALPPPLPLTPEALAARLGTGRLAIALTNAVPAGQYGKQALIALGLWDTAAPRLAETDNTRSALALVARGEVPLGLGYATDAVAEPRVAVVAQIPPGSHAPVRYPAALTAGAGPEAAAFAAFLGTGPAQSILRAHGFAPPGETP